MTREKDNKTSWWMPCLWVLLMVGGTVWGSSHTGSVWTGLLIGALVVIGVMAACLMWLWIQVSVTVPKKSTPLCTERDYDDLEEDDEEDDDDWDDLYDDERLYPDSQAWDMASRRWRKSSLVPATPHRGYYWDDILLKWCKIRYEYFSMLSPYGQSWNPVCHQWLDDTL